MENTANDIHSVLVNLYTRRIEEDLKSNSIVTRLFIKDRNDRRDFIASNMTTYDSFVFQKIKIPIVSRLIWNKYHIIEEHINTGVEWSLYKKNKYIAEMWHNLGMPIKCGEHLIKKEPRDSGQVIKWNMTVPIHYPTK